MALDPDYIRLLHPLDLDPVEVANEIDRLRAVIFEAYQESRDGCDASAFSILGAEVNRTKSP